MIPLYKPFMPELHEIDEILHSGNLASGIYNNRFEESLKKYFDVNSLIVTNSFHTAISVAITSIGLNDGDEVILSPMGCLASTQPYENERLKLVWADIDPWTGTLDPDSVRSKITPRTKCIVHNHFCGYAGYIDEINQIAHDNGIVVIDDGIECFGTEYKNRKIGNCGSDVTVFSFTAVRMPNTIDGGCVIFKDKKYYEKSKLIRDCGIDRTKFRDDLGEIDSKCDITLRGYSATMSNINAYIGIQQMKYIQRNIDVQREIAALWDQRVGGTQYKTIRLKDTLPNYWVYGILADDKRKTIQAFRDKGMYASGVHINNNIYSLFKDKTELPGVNDFYSKFVALPCGWWMSDEDKDKIIKI